MHVDLIASTAVDDLRVYAAYGYDMRPEDEGGITEADALAEFAGRLCYKSFNRPNPATATNGGYLGNIIDHGHFSVLEHSSATFLIRDVSRALLTELTRHRHLSFSVVSQRYVRYDRTQPVIPPALEGTEGEAIVTRAYDKALKTYAALVHQLTEAGLPRKQAREAARCVLPNAAPVDMVVTGNLRAWRDVLHRRWHVAADAEVQECAGLILEHLREIAPNSVQDIPTNPFGVETGGNK